MKAKLSFLALPFCLGLVLTFVLAACGGGNNNDEPPGNSSDSHPLSSEVVSLNVEFEGFELLRQGDKIKIYGNITGKGGVNSIATLTFTTTSGSGWVSYDGSKVTAPLTNLPKAINLNSEGAEIDLTNSSIPCGNHGISVKACGSATDQASCTSKNGTFEKPQSYCASSSSQTSPSSSSKAVWKFGAMQSMDIAKDASKTIGSITFKLIESTVGGMEVPAIEVTAGSVHELPSVPGLWDSDDGYPVAGKSYESSDIGNPGSAQTKIDLVRGDYYLISSGSQSYFIRFEAIDNNFGAWPKRARYWQVVERP